MNFRTINAAAGLLALLSGHAAASPRETVVYNGVLSNGLLNSAANGVRTNPFVGGYPLGRIDLSGTLSSVHPRTWQTDSRIVITAPDGLTSAVFQPFIAGTTYTTLPFNASLFLPAGTNAAGTWMFRFYEAFDDGGTAQVDAAWNITIVLTDDPPAPPTATDLGSLTFPGAMVAGAPLVAGGVRWYRFTLSGPIAAPLGRYLDADTYGSSLSGGPLPNDTAMALYDATGVLIAWDDDAGDGFTSQLSFGAGTRPGRGDGLPYDGRHGPLGPGLYYLAIAGFPTVFGVQRWEVASTATEIGTINLTLATNLGAPCYANCDGSTTTPVLNVNDFICFQSRFAAQDPYANCDGSTTLPVLNVNDFICFQGRFAGGCP